MKNKKKRNLRDYPRCLRKHVRDNCEDCGGTRGGQLGNENVVTVDGKSRVVCDDCSCKY